MKLIIFDFNKTLYDPATQQLFPGVLATLNYFQTLGAKRVLFSTEAPDRAQLLEKLGIVPLFDNVSFVAQKTAATIQNTIRVYGATAHDTLIIGDDPNGELLVAQQLHVPAIAVGTGYCDKQTAETLGAAFCASIKDVPGVKL